ncbi:MAG: hypothetical protein M0Q49_01945 [Porticoccaceae bacterium]|nr:hypothetical protein [Porticoccaceae bacterium]
MRKARTDSPLAALAPAQQDELFAVLRTMPYGRAAEWVLEQWGIESSPSALARWWKRESRSRLRAQIRRDIDLSTQFDTIADEEVLDERMRKALKDGFFRYVAADDSAAALEFARMALRANHGANEAARITHLAEAQRLAREKFEAAEARLGEIKNTVEDAQLSAEEREARIREIFGL